VAAATAPAPTAAPAPRVGSGDADLLFALPLARGLTFAALASWGALHWMSMMQPAEPGRGWAVVGVGLLAMFAMLIAGRRPGRQRTVFAVVSLIPLTALTLLAGGSRDELLRPDDWSELVSGISRGISDLPGVRVPYEGIDPWLKFIIPAGGGALVLLAAVLAFWPRRSGMGHPGAALLALITLYVTPVVALPFPNEFLRGAVFTLLTVAYLRLEKLRMPDAGAAAALALGSIVLALAAAPLLNRNQPWWDYESWALETSAAKSTSYSWNHSYGPLDWPRDGRELLRVKAKRGQYWKTENLDTFDGTHWLRTDATQSASDEPNPKLIKQYSQTIRVSVRNLRSEQFVTSGYATLLDDPNVGSLPTMDGLYLPDRPLRRGDTYTARVYNPYPTVAQRQHAGDRFPFDLDNLRTIQVPAPQLGVSTVRMTFPAFGDKHSPIQSGPPNNGLPPTTLIDGTPLGRVYALAQRLKADADTPEDFVQNVINYLSPANGFSYNELPPAASDTLPGFLLQSKQGYCQHYSGAMALLLRMGGVPARVATGFSTGAQDTRTGEYVVRDFDAHSWVEVYYPSYGWVTFDPTPADSPARSQPTDGEGTPSAGSGSAPQFGSGDAPSSRSDAHTTATDGTPWWQYGLYLVGSLLLVGAATSGLRRWRHGAPTAMWELQRALRRSGRSPSPSTTLRSLEDRFAGTPAAAAYVRALREARFRGSDAHPTRAQRRGLRSELARGAGFTGRLRAWWALPPR
jgi:transglutaminase-like putative cysteine protease